MARYQRKPGTVEAARLSDDADVTLADGTVIPAGHWLVIHDTGKVTAEADETFRDTYEAVTDTASTAQTTDATTALPVVDVGQPGAV